MNINLAMVGSTGAVGQEVLKILNERNVKINSLKLLASKRSAGKTIEFRGEKLVVEEATPDSFENIDVAIFSAGGSISKILGPEAVKRGTVVIDNSNAFRMETDVPLVIPEINPHAIHKHKGLISNPNCSTIQMLVALKPLYDYSKIKKIWVSTYQSVSGTGTKAIKELKELSQNALDGKELNPKVYPKAIAFNVLPHLDVFQPNGYTLEEMKMVNETKKIFEDEEIIVEPTAVRVPVINCHSEAVTIETEKEITPQKARALLDAANGVCVMDNIEELIYPTPLDVAGKDDVYVGRIRKGFIAQNALSMWVVGDNLRKGAALNAVQILEYMIDKECIKW
ncbi:aspartate-semialdehyde dehydrogenase [Lutibacter sp. B2]|nr:aspartate-semialdehyde dehydrogenase [Lutibacter sp. B2]